jgi:predicted PurR-regulated permease PerM
VSAGPSSTGDDDPHQPSDGSGLARLPVSAVLVVAAAWCWRILVVAVTFLALLALFNKLYLVFLPVFFALLLSALLHPLVALLSRWRLPRVLATWVTVIVAFVVLGGIGWFVAQRASSNYQQFVNQVTDLVADLRTFIERLPFANPNQLQQLQQEVVTALKQHSGTIVSDVFIVGRLAGELLTGLILTLFITFFFLDEGDRMWSWLVRLLPRDVQPSVRGAGYRSWRVLSGWVVGTAIIAAFHGTLIGLVLFLLNVPLALPLAVLVFIGSFIPLIGALLFGGLAVLVTLVSQGPLAAVILVGVLLVENQIEAHLLQPFIVGRAVRLHPVAIVLALTAGGLTAGLFGAILAIPIVASANAAVKYLTGIEDLDGNPHGTEPDRAAPEPPPDYAPLPIYAARPPLVTSEGVGSNVAQTSEAETSEALTGEASTREQQPEAEGAHDSEGSTRPPGPTEPDSRDPQDSPSR